jgi:hypothetical protein
MRLGKRERQKNLLAHPDLLAKWVEQRRSRKVGQVVRANEGLRPERLSWRVDKSFHTDYSMGKAYDTPREMRAALGSVSTKGAPKRWGNT